MNLFFNNPTKAATKNGAANQKKHGYFNRIALILNAQFDNIMMVLQVML